MRSKGIHSAAARGYWRLHAHRKKRAQQSQHGKPQCVIRDDQPDVREAGRTGVAERLVVPRKPGNAGGGKGPQFKTDARRGDGPGDWGDLATPKSVQKLQTALHAKEGVKSCPRAGCGEIRQSDSMSGVGNGAMAEPVRHRQTKGAATDIFDQTLPRHTSTIPSACPSDSSRNTML
jgi:hypothetical protein